MKPYNMNIHTSMPTHIDNNLLHLKLIIDLSRETTGSRLRCIVLADFFVIFLLDNLFK